MTKHVTTLNENDFKILSKKLLFELPKYGFQVWGEQHEFFSRETHQVITVHLNDWVQIIPVHDDKLVMVKQYRGPWRMLSLEFPAGKIEDNEEPLLAAKRELAEEAGYKAEKWSLIGVSKPITWTTQNQYLYVAEDLSPYKLEEDPMEYFTVHEFTPKEIFSLIETHEILETPTIASFFKYLAFKHPETLQACLK